GNDGVLQPGETANLFFYLSNAGNVGLNTVHASLSYIAGDIDNDGTPDPITIVQSESNYPGPPCLAASQQGQADCDHPQPAPPACANIVPFVVTVPAGHPVDVSRNFELFITGNPVDPTVSAPESTTGVSYQGSINANV